jgi:hypothetical protein
MKVYQLLTEHIGHRVLDKITTEICRRHKIYSDLSWSLEFDTDTGLVVTSLEIWCKKRNGQFYIIDDDDDDDDDSVKLHDLHSSPEVVKMLKTASQKINLITIDFIAALAAEFKNHGATCVVPGNNDDDALELVAAGRFILIDKVASAKISSFVNDSRIEMAFIFGNIKHHLDRELAYKEEIDEILTFIKTLTPKGVSVSFDGDYNFDFSITVESNKPATELLASISNELDKFMRNHIKNIRLIENDLMEYIALFSFERNNDY